MGDLRAIERCAYCRQYVPVTYRPVRPAPDDAALKARVAVCEDCLWDDR